MNTSAPWDEISLTGRLDLHVHTAPDVRPRWCTALELAQLAQQAGMAGFVLKNHHESTVGLAAEVRDRFPDLLVCGGLVLNRDSGGIDPQRAQQALEAGARVIWLPTKDGCGERDHREEAGGIKMVDERGKVRSELRAVLDVIAKSDAVLATGHIAAGEVLPVMQAAREAGVRRLLVNHPEIPFLQFPVSLQKELRSVGAVFERCFPRPEARNGFDQIAAEIREVGVETTILATDLGRRDLPPPLSGLRRMIYELGRRGFSDQELDLMTSQQPLDIIRN